MKAAPPAGLTNFLFAGAEPARAHRTGPTERNRHTAINMHQGAQKRACKLLIFNRLHHLVQLTENKRDQTGLCT